MSYEKKVSSSSLYPCFKTIESDLTSALKNKKFDFLKDALNGMMEKFKKYKTKIIDYALICHVLDPRFKLTCIQSKDDKRQAKELIENLFEIYSNKFDTENSQVEETLTSNQKKESKISLTERFLAKFTKTKTTNEDELDRYFKKPIVEYSDDFDVLKYWKENRQYYPVVSLIAKDYLAIQVTSLPSERTFSGASETIKKKRSKLETDTVHELLCLKTWLK